MTLFFKSLYHPFTISETLPGFIFSLTVSVVIYICDSLTVQLA